jgi:hypothetical protein
LVVSRVGGRGGDAGGGAYGVVLLALAVLVGRVVPAVRCWWAALVVVGCETTPRADTA